MVRYRERRAGKGAPWRMWVLRWVGKVGSIVMVILDGWGCVWGGELEERWE